MYAGINKGSYTWLLASLLGVLVVVIGLSSYVQAEINTRYFLPRIEEVAQFCRVGGLRVRTVKLIEYNRRKGEVVLYCLYAEARGNREIIVSKVEDTWVKSREELLNEPGKWVWPLYM